MLQAIGSIGAIILIYVLAKKTYKDSKELSDKNQKVDQFKNDYNEKWGRQFETMLVNNNWLEDN